jgi:hypothetical protein
MSKELLLQTLSKEKEYYENPGGYLDDEYYIRCQTKAEVYGEVIELVKTLL